MPAVGPAAHARFPSRSHSPRISSPPDRAHECCQGFQAPVSAPHPSPPGRAHERCRRFQPPVGRSRSTRGHIPLPRSGKNKQSVAVLIRGPRSSASSPTPASPTPIPARQGAQKNGRPLAVTAGRPVGRGLRIFLLVTKRHAGQGRLHCYISCNTTRCMSSSN